MRRGFGFDDARAREPFCESFDCRLGRRCPLAVHVRYRTPDERLYRCQTTLQQATGKRPNGNFAAVGVLRRGCTVDGPVPVNRKAASHLGGGCNAPAVANISGIGRALAEFCKSEDERDGLDKPSWDPALTLWC